MIKLRDLFWHKLSVTCHEDITVADYVFRRGKRYKGVWKGNAVVLTSDRGEKYLIERGVFSQHFSIDV